MADDTPGPVLHEPPDGASPDALSGEGPGGFRADLGVYLGPVELLSHLVRKSELDVRGVPLAGLVSQFEAYVAVLGYLDLAETGEFLATAARLLELKSGKSLPAPPKREKKEAAPEARTALLARLLEYRRYKEAAAELDRRAGAAADRLPRIVEKPEAERRGFDRVKNVELWDLVGALARVLEPPEEVGAGSVKREEIPVRVWVERIGARVRGEGAVRFLDLFPDPADRPAVVGAFLAVLELVRHHGFRAEQPADFAPIVLRPPGGEPASA